MTQLPIPVHAGSEAPEYWDDVEARQKQYGGDAAPWLQKQRRSAIAKPDLDWNALGFEPRWVGSDTADCVVALQPSQFAGHGADEFARFREGAKSRGEIALVISPIGDPEAESSNVHSIFGPRGGSVSIGQTYTSINGRLLGKEAKVRLVVGLGDADGDLARRLLSLNSAPRWRSLSLSGAVMESIYGREQHAPEGSLIPILETELGEPVVAAWLSPDGVERRYIVPLETPWSALMQWLLAQALPEFVPGAIRRARRQLGTDVFLMTRGEKAARAALAEFEADYVARKEELERQLEDAESAASTIREGLLYGTGQQLVDAVQAVFESAGVTVVDLDQHLGGTKNADLLCTYGAHSRLVEVKGVSGSPSESLYQDLLRHLREWPSLPGSIAIDGGALVLNHEHRKVPQDRSRRPYSRQEFLASQVEPILTTLDVFDAWREEDHEAVRRLLFGSAAQLAEESSTGATAPLPAPEARPRRWFGRR